MIIEIAQSKDEPKIAKLDYHIPPSRLGECIRSGQVYVLKDDPTKNGGQDHRLAKTWTDKIKKEVTEDGINNQTKTSSDISKA